MSTEQIKWQYFLHWEGTQVTGVSILSTTLDMESDSVFSQLFVFWRRALWQLLCCNQGEAEVANHFHWINQMIKNVSVHLCVYWLLNPVLSLSFATCYLLSVCRQSLWGILLCNKVRITFTASIQGLKSTLITFKECMITVIVKGSQFFYNYKYSHSYSHYCTIHRRHGEAFGLVFTFGWFPAV